MIGSVPRRLLVGGGGAVEPRGISRTEADPEQIFRSLLSPKQLRQYEAGDSIEIVGSKGNAYSLIDYGDNEYGYVTSPSRAGFCIGINHNTPDWYEFVRPSDGRSRRHHNHRFYRLIAFKLAIETNETLFWDMAG